MPTRSRLPFAAALLLALAALVAVIGVAGAGARIKIPKVPKVVERNVMISASGTITYRWTYDNREKCVPGYSKTVEEELRFNFPPRKTRLAIVVAKLVTRPLKGGSGTLDVRVGGFQTTNYCAPHPKSPEPPEPTCKSGSSPLVLALSSTIRDLPSGGDDEDELTPLSRESQVLISRTKPFAQNPKCNEERPKIPFEYQDELGWTGDPAGGIALGMNAPSAAYAKLKKGKTLRRQIEISGGCGGASAHASVVSKVPDQITKCTLDGVVFVKLTGV
jgi:hypothetical protein